MASVIAEQPQDAATGPDAQTRTILVTGATGKQGRGFVRAVLSTAAATAAVRVYAPAGTLLRLMDAAQLSGEAVPAQVAAMGLLPARVKVTAPAGAAAR